MSGQAGNQGSLQEQRQLKIKTVFITGANGYIGGAVAEKLRDAGYTVIGLVRQPETAELLKKRGIEPIVGSLEDVKILQAAVARCDAVIHTADSDHPGSVDILLASLEKTGKTFIHTSGSSVICDDARGEYKWDKVFTEDTYSDPIPVKKARAAIDRKVREYGINHGIRTIIICPCMIYGVGKGIRTESQQIPMLEKLSQKVGAGLYIGKGVNVWSNVHIADVVDLYVLALEKAPSASFFFAENGENTLKEVAEAVSRKLGFGGKTISWDADEALKEHGPWINQGMVGANSRVRSLNSRVTLGWKPTGPTLREAMEKNI